MKGIPHDDLDFSKSDGDSYRIRECNECIGQGNSLAVQVTRRPDGFLWHCFRCNLSGFVSLTGASPAEVQQVLKTARGEKKDTRPAVVTLPDDYTEAVPAKALVQLYDTGITDEDISFFDIGWSQAHSRIIFPVYKYVGKAAPKGGTTEPYGKKLIGYLGRKLAEDTTEKPKWFSVRQRDVKHPRFMGLPRQPFPSREVTVVEDILSAIRISQVGRLSVALLTTYLPYELYTRFKGWSVNLWLDADAVQKSIKYQASLGRHGVTSNVVRTDHDPKAYCEAQINEAIEHGKIVSKDYLLVNGSPP